MTSDLNLAESNLARAICSVESEERIDQCITDLNSAIMQFHGACVMAALESATHMAAKCFMEEFRKVYDAMVDGA